MTKNKTGASKSIELTEDEVVRAIRDEMYNANQLNELSTDVRFRVRYFVARSRRVSPATLRFLCDDVEWNVRCGVAENARTKQESLTYLAGDNDIDVLEKLMLNPNTPQQAFRDIYQSDVEGKPELVFLDPATGAFFPAIPEDWRGRHNLFLALSKRSTLAESQFATYAQHTFPKCREYISLNPNTPIAVLVTLLTDDFEQVGPQAMANICSPERIPDLQQYFLEQGLDINVADLPVVLIEALL
jgi:hypothetical protein